MNASVTLPSESHKLTEVYVVVLVVIRCILTNVEICCAPWNASNHTVPYNRCVKVKVKVES